MLENLVGNVDSLILGGGMANTFLLARGQDVGASLVEADMDTARAIEAGAEANGCHIVLPEDFLVAGEFAANVPHRVAMPGDVEAGEMILDAGPASAEPWRGISKHAAPWSGTVPWAPSNSRRLTAPRTMLRKPLRR